jgi:hypothetical protein
MHGIYYRYFEDYNINDLNDYKETVGVIPLPLVSLRDDSYRDGVQVVESREEYDLIESEMARKSIAILEMKCINYVGFCIDLLDDVEDDEWKELVAI